MIYLAWALVILIASMFVGLIIAAWMRRQDDDGTYGADEGWWQ